MLDKEYFCTMTVHLTYHITNHDVRGVEQMPGVVLARWHHVEVKRKHEPIEFKPLVPLGGGTLLGSCCHRNFVSKVLYTTTGIITHLIGYGLSCTGSAVTC